MRIELLIVGKPKSPWLKEGIEYYKKLVSKYSEVTITSIKDSDLDSETERLRAALNPRSTVVLLEATGKSYDSESFARFLEKTKLSASSIQFVIGGAFGLSDTLKHEYKNHLSLSQMTFPHELTIVVLLEQLYRAFSISAGTKYHK